MNFHRTNALTLTEILICLVVVGVMVLLAWPNLTTHNGMGRGQMTQTLSNMKQLHLATMQMALDGETTGDKTLGWPGDTGGTFSNWATQLITNGYLTTNDFCTLLSAPGIAVKRGKIPTMAEGAILVYAVSTNSSEDSVFLTTANFTNSPTGGLPLEKKAKPFGDKGSVVFRKRGKSGGAILLNKHVGQTNMIGSFVPLLK